MRVSRLCLGVLFLALAVPGRAADAPAALALRLVPAPADLVVQVPQPRKLWDSLANLDYVRKGLEFAPIKELLDGTLGRCLRQLVAYAEKQLGVPHEDLMDRLGVKGLVLAVATLGDKAPVMMALEGTDEKLVGRCFALA